MEIEERLISFETAKLAKEKGFVLPCHSYYFEDGEFKENELTGTNGYYGEEYCFSLEEFDENWNDNGVTKKNGDRCFGCSGNKDYFKTFSAPTQSLLQKWLREIHGIQVYVYSSTIRLGKYSDYVIHINEKSLNDARDEEYQIYEDAFEVGLREALKIIP